MSYAPIHSESTFHHPDSLFDRSDNRSLVPQTRSPKSPRRRKSAPRRRAAKPETVSDFPIIVHCHLCWDWVWQRPQQFVSRLSRRHKILFVETIGPDPELAAPLARFRRLEEFPNLTLLRLQFPSWRWSESAYVDAERRRLVREFLSGPLAGHFENPVQWFYDPMAVAAFAGHLNEAAIVYDCMDELSKFRYAPPEILKREAELLARADVVFAGGRKLHKAKSQHNDNCHFFGCGVDWRHFGLAREAHTQVPSELAALPKPVLGYFGVVDERMDYDLIARLAEENPAWSVVMVGPVLKVSPDALPRRPNLHWLGQRPYADLPALCKGFDLCLMPFALNEATEFINPTKALEYMATGRMIVSTAVPDVVRNFGSVVKIARSPGEFVSLCRQAIGEPDTGALARGLRLAQDNSWESIVAQLEDRVEEVLLQKRSTARKSPRKTARNGRLNLPVSFASEVAV